MSADVSLEAVLIFTRAVFLIGACGVMGWAFVQWRRESQLQARRVFEQIDLALAEMRAMQEVISRIETRVHALSGQVEAGARQAPVQTGTAARGYDLAVRLAKRGAPIEELVGSCGITRHEAELLVRLHSIPAQPMHNAAAPSQTSTSHTRTSQTRAQAAEHKNEVSWPIPPQAASPAPEAPRAAARKRGSLLSVVG